jgi:hypothetical protein
VAWRRVPGQFWGADEAGEEAVVGWATAESFATGYGADHDRMTSVHSRSSSSEPLVALDQGLGQW